MPIEFEVLRVPEKVYRRYARYNLWWRHHPAVIVLCIILVLAGVTYLVIDDIRSDDPLFGNGYFWLVYAIIMLTVMPNGLYDRNQRFLAARCEYVFQENDVIARTHETYKSWKYSALAYAREAKDAFYLVLNEKAGEAMVIPKEAFTPEQCGALVEILQKGVPEGKFTRWKGAGKEQ